MGNATRHSGSLAAASLLAALAGCVLDEGGSLHREGAIGMGGCTLTADAWREHSEYGAARYDETWAELPAGADTEFLASGRTYHEVLWTGAEAGPYYALARPYIAAELSQLAGAGREAVAGAFADATEILTVFSAAEIAALPRSSELRAEVAELAEILGAYARGELGPGGCAGGAADRAAR